MIPFNKPPLKVDGGIYIARDERRIPRVVVLVSLKAETEHHGLVAAYHERIDSADPPLTCCTPAEFKRWYRPRRQFLFWKEHI